MSNRLKELRIDRDLRQQDIAEYLKCSQVCYSNYENGKRETPIEVLVKLADFYKTSVDYILGRTNQKNAYPKNGK